jgi:hypothetical protein
MMPTYTSFLICSLSPPIGFKVIESYRLNADVPFNYKNFAQGKMDTLAQYDRKKLPSLSAKVPSGKTETYGPNHCWVQSVQADRDNKIVAMAKKMQTKRNLLRPSSATIEDELGTGVYKSCGSVADNCRT